MSESWDLIWVRSLSIFILDDHLIYKESACYFMAIILILRVDDRDASPGRSVVYCLNMNTSCYSLTSHKSQLLTFDWQVI